MNIDAALLAKARERSGSATDTETVDLALRTLVAHQAAQELRRLWIGSDPHAEDVPRQRERLREQEQARAHAKRKAAAH